MTLVTLFTIFTESLKYLKECHTFIRFEMHSLIHTKQPLLKQKIVKMKL